MELPAITILGRGRLATHVAHRLNAQGVGVQLLPGRTKLTAAPSLTWILVPDDHIGSVAAQIPTGGIILHSSGALPPEVLAPHTRTGAIHPIMTFAGPLSVTQSIPATFAGDPSLTPIIRLLCEHLGWDVVPFDGDRALYHAACVVAGNLSATLLVAASRLLGAAGAQPDPRLLLEPLALASIRNVTRAGPDAMTGPITRGDEATIRRHSDAIDHAMPELSASYEALIQLTRNIVADSSEKRDT